MKKLKEEDPKKWTLARIAVALGVRQKTVSEWLELSNIPSTKAKDARLSLSAADKMVILEQAKAVGVSGKLVSSGLPSTAWRAVAWWRWPG